MIHLYVSSIKVEGESTATAVAREIKVADEIARKALTERLEELDFPRPFIKDVIKKGQSACGEFGWETQVVKWFEPVQDC